MKGKHAQQQQAMNLRLWMQRHIDAGRSSIGRMSKQPFASLMTICVIGIALALPAVLYVILQNSRAVTASWERGSQISVFLKMDVNQDQIDKLLAQLRLRDDVGSVKYITPQQGLQQLQSQAEFGDVLTQLPSNPLPGVIEVYPSTTLQSPQAIKSLVVSLQQLPQADSVKLDMQWLQRLYSMISIAQRGVYALVLLLAIGVLLVIGNTIRLATQNHRKEIEVIKLVGATNSFVRRPFLYSGLYYGLLGGIFAWLMVGIFLLWLNNPVERLSQLYGAHFHLLGLGLLNGLVLLLLSAGLGLFGAWLAVNRHLNAVEPR